MIRNVIKLGMSLMRSAMHLLVFCLMLFTCRMTEYEMDRPSGLLELVSEYPEFISVNLPRYVNFKEVAQLRLVCTLFKDLLSFKSLPQKQREDLMRILSQIPHATVKQLSSILPSDNFYDLNFTHQDKTPLYAAVFNNHGPEIIEYLVRRGALLDKTTIRSTLDCLMYTQQAIPVFRTLLRLGCPLSHHGHWNYFNAIVTMSNSAMFKVLCEFEKVSELVNVPDSEGQTPIFYATGFEVASSLVSWEADVRHMNNLGETPLQFIERTRTAISERHKMLLSGVYLQDQ